MATKWIHNGGWDPHPEPIEVWDVEELVLVVEDAQPTPESSTDDMDEFTCFLS